MKKYYEFLPCGGHFTRHLDVAFDRIEMDRSTKTIMLHDARLEACIRVATRTASWPMPSLHTVDDGGYISRMTGYLDEEEKKIFLLFFNGAAGDTYSCLGEASELTACCRASKAASVAYDLWQWCVMAMVATGMMAPVKKFSRRKNKEIKLFRDSGKFSLYAGSAVASMSREPDGSISARVCDRGTGPAIRVAHTASGRVATVYDDGYIYDTASALMTKPKLEFFLKILSSWGVVPQPAGGPSDLIMGMTCPAKKTNFSIYTLGRAVAGVYALESSLTSE